MLVGLLHLITQGVWAMAVPFLMMFVPTWAALRWAVHEAALDVKRIMVERAAKTWKVEPDQVGYADGVFTNLASPDEKLTFKEIAARALSTGGPIVGRASW